MRKFLLLCAMLIAVASPAAAAGVNFAWDDCWAAGGASQISNKAFACGTNTGTARMVGSYVLAADQSGFVGLEIVADLQADAGALPAWWDFYNSGACRQNSLSATFDFSIFASAACSDPFGQPGQGGLAAYQTNTSVPPNPYPDASRARMKAAGAIADPVAITANTEYYAVSFNMNYQKTTGTGSCAGCATPVTIVLNSIKSAELQGTSEFLSDPVNNQCLTFNGPSGVNCAALPVLNTSWGRVKSLYR